jgi:predicted permease
MGIDPHHMLTMRLALPENRYPGPDERVAFHDRFVEHLRVMAGVESVAVTSHLPNTGALRGRLEIEGRDVTDKAALPNVNYLVVGPGYFDVMGVRLLGGRDLAANDGAAGSEAVVVNELFAAKFLRGQEPIGTRIRLGANPDSPWATIVGVSPHIWQAYDNRAETDAVVYVPYRQSPVRGLTAVVRSRVAPSELTRTLRARVQALDPDLPLYFVKTMEDHLSEELWPYRVFGGLFAMLGAIALLLAVVGLYAVMAYGVSRRTHEIGIRTAAGAGQRDVLWLVLRQGLLQLALGLGIGLLGALAVGRVVAAMLLETTGTDPLTAVTVSLILSLVALAACVVPARRASRLDPVAALRARG